MSLLPITYEKLSVQDTAFKSSYPLHFYEFGVCMHMSARTHTHKCALTRTHAHRSYRKKERKLMMEIILEVLDATLSRNVILILLSYLQ